MKNSSVYGKLFSSWFLAVVVWWNLTLLFPVAGGMYMYDGNLEWFTEFPITWVTVSVMAGIAIAGVITLIMALTTKRGRDDALVCEMTDTAKYMMQCWTPLRFAPIVVSWVKTKRRPRESESE